MGALMVSVVLDATVMNCGVRRNIRAVEYPESQLRRPALGSFE